MMKYTVENRMVAQPAVALLVPAPAGATQIELDIDERNLGTPKLAQTAIASTDAHPATRIPTVVAYINPGIDITRGSVK